jgi:hypothetical protein
MPTTYKVLGQANPAAATPTTLYTAANPAVVSTINVCNTSATATTFNIAVRPAGATLANLHYVAYNTPLAGSTTISFTMGITLAATDVVTVQAASSSLSFSAFGSEVY